jgi:hypothetical protein
MPASFNFNLVNWADSAEYHRGKFRRAGRYLCLSLQIALLVANFEPLHVAPGRPCLDVRLVDMTGHRFRQRLLELVQFGRGPFDDDLHSAIGQIFHPAGNVKASCHTAGRNTKTNALDVS